MLARAHSTGIIFFFLLLYFISNTIEGYTQHSKYFDHHPLAFREAIELLQNEHYGAAKVKLEDFLAGQEDANHASVADAHYYALLCAVQLSEKNAAEKVREFSIEYSSTSWMPRVAFLEGRLLFEQKRYSEALAAFDKVEENDLPDFEKAELNYKTAFCLMRQNKSSEAVEKFAFAKELESPYKQPSTYYYAHIQYMLGNFDDAANHFERIEKAVQYKKIVPQYLLHIYHQKGDYQYVINNGENVLQLSDSKRKSDIAQLIADAWYKNNDYNKTIHYYQIAITYGRKQLSRDDHYQKGISHFKLEQYPEAIIHLEQVAGTDEDALAQNAAYHLGLAYHETGQKTFARNAFLKANRLNHDPQLAEDALFNYAKLSMESSPDPYNEAVGLLEKYLENTPESNRKSEASQLIVQLYLHTRNYEAALASLEKSRNSNPELEKIYQQLSYTTAIEHFKQGDYLRSIQYFDRIKHNKNSENAAAAYFWTAESQFLLGQYVESRQSLQQFFNHRAATATGLIPKARYLAGYTHFQLKQYKAALQQFIQFTKEPTKEQTLVYDAWLRIGDCYFVSKEYQPAIDAYDKVINNNQNGADYAMLQKGLALGATAKFNEKIASFAQLTKRFPNSIYYDQALYEMGSTSLITNDLRSAIAYFDKLVKERPRSVYAREALLKTGLIYFNNNQNEQAVSQLKKVAEMYPGTPDAREAMNTLKVIYMDMNQLNAYIDFTQKMGMGHISNSEQDSLAFAIAENLYLENKWEQALTAFREYVNKPDGGAYILQGHHYLYQLYLKGNQPDKALESLEFIIAVKGNPYAEQALLQAARIYYDRQDYEKASKLYHELFELSTDKNERSEALEGKMKSAYFIKNYSEALNAAMLLRDNQSSTTAQKIQAAYIAGKSLLEMNQLEEAKTDLLFVRNNDRTQFGAEAQFLIAKISYQSDQFEDTESNIFELAEQYPNQEYWVAKGFLLLADVYVKQNNIFQAKETLKSIVDNYRGEDLRDEAARKLSMLQ